MLFRSSYVLSVSGLMRRENMADGIPRRDVLEEKLPETMANGGSCLAGPDGEWVIEPVTGREDLLVADIVHQRVREERQNFDPVGHYARPDVTRLTINRQRQSTLAFEPE